MTRRTVLSLVFAPLVAAVAKVWPRRKPELPQRPAVTLAELDHAARNVWPPDNPIWNVFGETRYIHGHINDGKWGTVMIVPRSELDISDHPLTKFIPYTPEEQRRDFGMFRSK